jgi:hypothetical protein
VAFFQKQKSKITAATALRPWIFIFGNTIGNNDF